MPTKTALLSQFVAEHAVDEGVQRPGPDGSRTDRRARGGLAEGGDEDLHGRAGRADRTGRAAQGAASKRRMASSNRAGAVMAPARRLRRGSRGTESGHRGAVHGARRSRTCVLFFGYPVVKNVVMGFQHYTSATFFTGIAPWVGFENYSEVLHSAVFSKTAVNTVLFTAGSIAGQFSIGLGLALYFQRRFPLSGVLRSLLLLPWLIPLIVSSAIWRWILDEDNGALNRVLTGLHARRAPRLADQHVAGADRRDPGEHLDRHPVQRHDPATAGCRTSRRSCTRPPRSTAPRGGRRSATSPGRCCGPW